MQLKIILLVLFFCYNTVLAQSIITTDTDLQNEVNSASPGDIFIIKNGVYEDFYASLTANGTKENPIVIKAETIGGVTLTLDSHFAFKKASHIVLEGFIFNCTGNNTLVKLEASNNIRITRNEFELITNNPVKWIVVTGYYNDYAFDFLSHHNRIDHNTFKNKTTAGNFITIDGTYNEDKTINQQSQYDKIDYNYFYNTSPRIENGKEAIRIGNSLLSTTNGFTTVEFNLFEECDGDPEILSVKSNDNIIRHNTFKRNYGTLTLRQGNRNLVEGNYFFGDNKENGIFITDDDKELPIYTGGIRVYGTDHIIINNYLEGLKGTRFDAPITLTQGDAITGVDTDQSLHYRAERIKIAYNTLLNNTFGIEIGYAKGNGSYDKQLIDITFANNVVTGASNSLINIYNNQLGEINWINNIMFPIDDAILINNSSSFINSEISIEDPNLVLNNGIWKATTFSSTKQSGVSFLNVNEDIDGQVRPEISNVGADHFGTSAEVYFPITVDDVGPDAYQSTLSVEEDRFIKSKTLLYPNPTKGNIEILVTTHQKDIKVILYNVVGKLIEQKMYKNKSGKIQLNIENQLAGLYFLRVELENQFVTYKLIKN